MLLVAPQLRQLAAEHKFVSPTAYIDYRYDHRPLKLVVSFCMVLGGVGQTLAQFKSLGATAQGFTGGAVHPTLAALVFGAVMLFCEYMGGMRAVVWSDAIQAVVMLVTFALTAALLQVEYGGLRWVLTGSDSLLPASATQVPPLTGSSGQFGFLSFCLLYLSAPFYPHYMHRFYAASSTRQLKIVTIAMSWSPLVVNIVTTTLGLVALARFGPDPGFPADQTFARICADIMTTSLAAKWIVNLMVCAVFAAIMSTTDSLLVSISSTIVADFLQPTFFPNADEATSVRATTIGSAVLVSLNVLLTLVTFQLTSLIVLQQGLLLQCVPAFIVGLHNPHVRGDSAFLGAVLGVTLTSVLIFVLPDSNIGGWDAGLFGLLLNIGTTLGHHYAKHKHRERHCLPHPTPLRPALPGRFPLQNKPLLISMAACVVMMIPFYRPTGVQDELLWVFPSWALVSLVAVRGLHRRAFCVSSLASHQRLTFAVFAPTTQPHTISWQTAALSGLISYASWFLWSEGPLKPSTDIGEPLLVMSSSTLLSGDIVH